MSGLFKTLFDIRSHSQNESLEDFFTELFAYSLRTQAELLHSFLKYFRITEVVFEDYQLETQFELDALDQHNTNSRPDIALINSNHIIFFENKINAKEGPFQLKRYAEHLDNFDIKNKSLVYITKHYDIKNEDEIFENCTSKIGFIQIRWHQIFHFLKSYNEIQIVKEILIFMKQIHLSMSNQFSPVDILTLSNFSNTRKMLNETMFGKVSKRFKEINNAISEESTIYTQLRNHDRFTYYVFHEDGLTVFLGYWMNSENEKEYPDLGLYIEIAPSSTNRQPIIDIFSEIVNNYDHWSEFRLNDPTKHVGITSFKSLQDFLSSENQIAEIQNYFLERLDDLEQMFADFPELPKRHE